MSSTVSDYRLDGIYRQRQEGFFMQRVKLTAGVISAGQARAVAALSTRFGQGNIHLTTRGSLEIHWIRENDLAEVKRSLLAAGLTSRGACGGAVRGVTCASQGALGFPTVETLARRIHRHFTANPRFERLPKKFKIGVEADASSRRHLIQDVGLLLAGSHDGVARYDLFVAGGLGREPQPGFLFESGVSENRVIPLIEAIARVYAAHTPPGKRLKHLVGSIGEPEFRRLVAQEPSAVEELPPVTGLPENLLPPAGLRRIVAGVLAGELTSDQLLALADFADRWGGGFLVATVDQDIAFHVDQTLDPARAAGALEQAGFSRGEVCLRVCPGSHLCLAGLSSTRDIAANVLEGMGPAGRGLSWALSGCPNSCTQPQLAEVGIVTSGLVRSEDGQRSPRFDLYRSGDDAFGRLAESNLTLDQLYGKLRQIG